MNKLTKILTVVWIFLAINIASAGDKVIPFSKLPTKAQSFVKTFFSEKDVVSVTMDTEYLIQKEYTVIFDNGSKVEFDADGEWESIDMKAKTVPAKLVPVAIQQHIHKSFPNTFITEIKKKRQLYEVEISNGLELEFSRKGEFLKIDD